MTQSISARPQIPAVSRTRAAVLCAAIALAFLSYGVPAASANTLPGAAGCHLFPRNNVWHADISHLPVSSHSKAWIRSMGGTHQLIHPDFGRPPYGMPYTVVGANHPKVRLRFRYASESDEGPYPFGPDTPIEGGKHSTGDRHALMVDRSTCTLYELYDAHWSTRRGGSGAIWDLSSNHLRPATWTSADAAGLPILPGLVRYDEVRNGTLDHAIRLTAERTDKRFIWPARHQAGDSHSTALPPMGARFRLKASVDVSRFHPMTRVILRAMKKYGLFLADNGSNWYFTGTKDRRWTDTILDELKTIPAGDFVAVDESSLMVSPDSGQARRP